MRTLRRQDHNARRLASASLGGAALLLAWACQPESPGKDRPQLQDAGFLRDDAALLDLGYRDQNPPEDTALDAGILADASDWPQAQASPDLLSLQVDGQCKNVALKVASEPTLISPVIGQAAQGRVAVYLRGAYFRLCARAQPALTGAATGPDLVTLQGQDPRGGNYVSQVEVRVQATPSPFAARVVAVDYGAGAGFGQADFPDIVLGRPLGAGPQAGSLDVLSLGAQGVITIDLGQWLIDGPGPDLLIFENAFAGFIEPGRISVSATGEIWYPWPCAAVAPYAGCAGLSPVLSHPDNSRDPSDPSEAGGDAFDLAEIGISQMRFVKIGDVAGQDLGGAAAGFDLDALAVVHGLPLALDQAQLLATGPQQLGIGECAALRLDLHDDEGEVWALPVLPELSAQPGETNLASFLAQGRWLCAQAPGLVTLTWTYGPLSSSLRVQLGESPVADGGPEREQ